MIVEIILWVCVCAWVLLAIFCGLGVLSALRSEDPDIFFFIPSFPVPLSAVVAVLSTIAKWQTGEWTNGILVVTGNIAVLAFFVGLLVWKGNRTIQEKERYLRELRNAGGNHRAQDENQG